MRADGTVQSGKTPTNHLKSWEREMDFALLSQMNFTLLAEYANLALTWIGFGTVVGLASKAVMPGRDPGGPIATLLMGIAGTLIGCAVLKYFYPLDNIQPISPEGFAVGAVGAFVLLAFYRILGGYWFVEGEQPRRRSRRRRSYRNAYDD